MSLQQLALNQLKRNADARGLVVVMNKDSGMHGFDLPALSRGMRVVERREPLVLVKPIVVTIKSLGGRMTQLQYLRPVKMKHVVKDWNALHPNEKFKPGYTDFIINRTFVQDLDMTITADETIYMVHTYMGGPTIDGYTRRKSIITRGEEKKKKDYYKKINPYGNP